MEALFSLGLCTVTSLFCVKTLGIFCPGLSAGKYVDGNRVRWKPEIMAIKAVIQFVKATGRLQPQQKIEMEGEGGQRGSSGEGGREGVREEGSNAGNLRLDQLRLRSF
ncbi:hypothetical protein V502_03440 [Pseudogymnoascus sp. VKM F-4520 (FW-2644)]|nr:hypothetical protein V502_03440 [Pseudogymnoascus sp. VKM F-4520 (FW-2644)]